MPNWCTNHLTIKHADTLRLTEAQAAAERGELLRYFKCPPTLDYDYDWCIQNWGTKWDVNTDWVLLEDNCLEINADTAWTPPLQALKWAEAYEGFEIELYYMEPGAGFLGIMAGGHEEEWDWPHSRAEADVLLEKLPLEMIANLGLVEEFNFLFSEE